MFWMAYGAQAAENVINDAITLSNLDSAFEKAAAELKMMTVIYLNECSDKNPAWCSFHGKGQLEIRGLADTLDSPPSNISIFYTPDGDPAPFTLNVGLLVSICEPTMKQIERGKIITSLIQVAAGKKEGSIIEGKNCGYTVTNLSGTIIVVAEKAMK